MKRLNPLFWIFAAILLIPDTGAGQNIYDTLRTVKMTAIPNHQAKNITIQWVDDPDNNTYSLFKKSRQDTTWGDPLLVAGDQTSGYLDTDIEEGKLYEYRMLKETGDSIGYAYLFSGVNYVPPQRRGNILLLIDSTATNIVDETLRAYMDILTSEGWIPKLVAVSINASAQQVKNSRNLSLSILIQLVVLLLLKQL